MNTPTAITKRTISVVVPVYNEEVGLPYFHVELMDVLGAVEKDYDLEIIYIDDGSHDRSWEIIEALAREHKAVRGISFSRNFGHQNALEAGMFHAAGDAVITIDADLQHPPAIITEMLKTWEEGFPIVKTRRLSYQVPWFKTFTSSVFYRVMNRISDVRLEPGSADFRLLDRSVVSVISDIREGERFYRGLVEWVGFQSKVITYYEGKRNNGTSGYTFKKMLDLATTALTSFTTRPMKAIIVLGIAMTLASWILLAVMAYFRWVLESDYFSQMAFLVVFIIGNNGILFTAVGIIALYILRIHKDVQNKPNYIIKKHIQP